jgi:transcriptional regulator with XRE-family HTH domain
MTKISQRPVWNALLSQAVRILRRARLLKVHDVAQAMGLKPRTYEYFEAGGGQITLERLHRFAQAVRADPNGLVAAIMIGSPQFALRSADNKLVAAFLITLQEFDAAGGDDLKRIDTATYLTAFSETFDRLLEEARRKAELERATLERFGSDAPSEPPKKED